MPQVRPYVTLLAVVVGLTAAAPAAAQVPIQPGAAIESGGSGCTMSWIFDGRPGTPQAGRTYGMTAAHCVDGVGVPVRILPSEVLTGTGAERIGQVAFTGVATEEGRDYAFFEIDGEDLGQVDPRMKGHPGIPTGLPRHPRSGDTMQFSGYGDATFATSTTREGRTGVLNRVGDAEHQILGAISTGDSGGPVADLTDGGTAFGIVTDLGGGVQPDAMTVVVAGEFGMNLRWVLADAASRGFHVRLRTAAGTPAADDERAR